ncbi:hydroxymethylglutaryl-CoA synthase [Bifidobacterium aquikefiricola]|uniref:Hydroxymethylglutaryl-CoA synthase n=1 Tax=Bifidobacterium aquikefiricola TaxID=3059038 RepID=A0AB39U5R1_9BIFI
MSSNTGVRIGIDRMGMFVPGQYLDVEDLARARGVEPAKFTKGIGQSRMSVPQHYDDIVSMGANAIADILPDIDVNRLGLLIVGTESGIDQSKSSSLFIKHLVGLPNRIESFEIKEACFGGTAGLFAAYHYVAAHPDKTVLVVASDVARYGLGTAGEITQGAGAVAMLISVNPSILVINDDAEDYSDDINDFWRPNGMTEAVVDGKYSTQVYLDFFRHVFDAYCGKHALAPRDFAALLFHLPFTKMGMKALNVALENADVETGKRLRENFELSASYARNVGNLYTASLYLSLMSWLEHADDAAGQRIGLFSYGSGAMGKFFTGCVQPNYRQHLHALAHEHMLMDRERIDMDEYERMFTHYHAAEDAETKYPESGFYFSGVQGAIRQYSRA